MSRGGLSRVGSFSPPVNVAGPESPRQFNGALFASPFVLLAGLIVIAIAGGLALPHYGLMMVILAFAGVGITLVSMARPEFALFVFVFLLYSGGSEVSNTLLGLPRSAPGVAVYFAVIVVTAFVVRDGFRLITHLRPSDWYALALYGLVLAASVFVAMDRARAVYGVQVYVKNIVLVMVIIVIAIRTIADLNRVVWALVLAGLVPSVLTIYQVLTGSGNQFAGFAIINTGFFIPGEVGWVSRPAGPLGDPNFYSLVLVAVLPFSLYCFRYGRTRLRRSVALIAALAMCVAIFMTFSRGGLLALAAVILASAAFGFIRFRSLIVLGLIVLVALPFLPTAYTDRFSSVTALSPTSVLSGTTTEPQAPDQAIEGRSDSALVGVRMFLDHPILGVGTENYPSLFQSYGRPIGLLTRSARSSHSLYIQLAAETGVLGLATFGGLIVWLFLALRSDWQRPGQPYWLRQLTVAIGLSLFGFLAGSTFLHMAYPRFFWVLVAVAMASHIVKREVFPEPVAQPSRVGLVVGSISNLRTVQRFNLVVGFCITISLALVAVFAVDYLLETYRAPEHADSNRNVVSPIGLGQSPALGAFAPQTVIQNEPSEAQTSDSAAATAASSSTTVSPGPVSPTPTIGTVDDSVAPIFRTFWNQNGGAATFGLPTGPEIVVPGSGRRTQEFANVRLDYDPSLAGTRYVVQLGRRGFEDAERRGLLNSTPFTVRPAASSSGGQCVTFPVTGHQVCAPILEYWQNNGLDLGDSGKSFAESVALFGYPISEAYRDADTGLTVQYFERARLEYDASSAGSAVQVHVGTLQKR